MKLKLFDDAEFFNTAVKLAIPIALQNLILSSLNLIDTVIIGGLGETAIAGVGLANQYFFILNLFLYGVTTGASIFTAQYWGNKDVVGVKRVLGLCIISGGISALLFTIVALVFPEQIISIFSKDINVIRLGGEYLKIVAISYIVTSISYSYSFILRSIGKVKQPMYISGTAVIINTILNYLFIYGYLGFPQLGTRGSAIATVIARTIEAALFILVVYINHLPLAARLKELLDFTTDYVVHFFKVITPVILNETIWALGVTLYAVVFARMGTEVVASTNISSTVERVMWVVFTGLGSACGVMIGNKIGEGNYELAYKYAIKFSILMPIFGVFAGVILVLVAHPVLSLFKVSPIVYEYAYLNLIVLSLFLWARVFNFVCIVGVLRSGGDTKYSLLIDTGSVWIIGVPLAFISGLVLHLPIYIVYALISLEEIFKLIFGLHRMRSRKWINNLTY